MFVGRIVERALEGDVRLGQKRDERFLTNRAVKPITLGARGTSEQGAQLFE